MDSFMIKKTVKETKKGTTITIDIKRTDKASSTISGDLDEVIEELKSRAEEANTVDLCDGIDSILHISPENK